MAVALCVFFAMGFASCSKDGDEPDTKSIYGIWAEDGDPESWGLLITKDCSIMDDAHIGCAGFVPYLNASYETLEKRFAPNDEFFVYRYDSKNNVYILYSGDYEDEKGNILFDTNYPLLCRMTISKDIMEAQYQWPEFDYDGLVTREELLSNSKYASVPSNVKINFKEVRVYKRYK